MKKGIQFFLLTLLLLSCGNPMGDIVKTQNLDVYYINGVNKEDAVKFTKFWKRNGFIGKAHQTIQLELLKNNIVQVNLIEKKVFQDQPILLKEQIMLTRIQKMIRDSIFSKNRVNLVITDNTFKPLDRDL